MPLAPVELRYGSSWSVSISTHHSRLTAEILGHRVESAWMPAPQGRHSSLRSPMRRLWWPAGYGEQPLADLTVTLVDSRSRTRQLAAEDRFPHRRTGHVPRRDRHPFTISINGQPVFVKGMNWIPDDHFLTRITAERLGTPARPGPAPPTSTCFGSGAAASSRATSSIAPAMSEGCWSGRTSCWPARPTRKSLRCGRRLKPRPARMWCG